MASTRPASTIIPTGPKSSEGSGAADAEPKSFLAILAAHWCVGAAVASVILLIIVIKTIVVSFYPEKKDDPRSEASPDASNTNLSDQSPLANQMQVNPNADKHTTPGADLTDSPMVKAKVDTGSPCTGDKQHHDCRDDAVCVKETLSVSPGSKLPGRNAGEYYCKALIGAMCLDNECLDGATLARVLKMRPRKIACTKTKTCQVVPDPSCPFGFEAVEEAGEKLCKAEEDTRCDSPRDTAANWCMEGLECVKNGRQWACEKPATNAAQIQLIEATDAWRVANRSRLMQSNNFRKKRTQTAGFLQVDSD